jgi:hypothetical protein
MWQQHPDSSEGLYVRVGRFMPVFGLRLAEHIVYTQRFGGDPLYFEAYGANVSYVTKAFEVHATGFVHDPIATVAEHGDGGALYAEARLGEHAAIGVEGKHSVSDETTMSYGGVTGKLYLPGPDLQFQAEGEIIRQDITAGDGDIAIQLAGYLMASKPLDHGLMLDIGVGHFTQDTRVKGLYRDAIDANLHWFQTAHIEWLLTTRIELLDGDGCVDVHGVVIAPVACVRQCRWSRGSVHLAWAVALRRSVTVGSSPLLWRPSAWSTQS